MLRVYSRLDRGGGDGAAPIALQHKAAASKPAQPQAPLLHFTQALFRTEMNANAALLSSRLEADDSPLKNDSAHSRSPEAQSYPYPPGIFI
jgi:hypothetical protein